MTQNDFDDAFPNGVSLYQSDAAPVVDIPEVSIRENEGQVFGIGWAYPNKAYVFLFDKVKMTEHGWWVHDPDSKRVFLQPISPERQQGALALLES